MRTQDQELVNSTEGNKTNIIMECFCVSFRNSSGVILHTNTGWRMQNSFHWNILKIYRPYAHTGGLPQPPQHTLPGLPLTTHTQLNREQTQLFIFALYAMYIITHILYNAHPCNICTCISIFTSNCRWSFAHIKHPVPFHYCLFATWCNICTISVQNCTFSSLEFTSTFYLYMCILCVFCNLATPFVSLYTSLLWLWRCKKNALSALWDMILR